MQIKFLFPILISYQLAAGENLRIDVKNCNREAVAQVMRNLLNLQVSSSNASPEQKNFDWLEKEIRKLPPSVATNFTDIKEKIDADAKERFEKLSEGYVSQYRTLKKQIAEGKVDGTVIPTTNRFTAAFNTTSGQIYINAPKEGESNDQFIIRNAIGFNTHRMLTQNTTSMVDDLLKDIEKKCIPPGLPQGITIGDTKFRALYCVDPDPTMIKDLNQSNGKQSEDECRTHHTCGVRSVATDPAPQFREITMSFACKKKNNECPEITACLQQAAVTEQMQATPGTPNNNTAPGAQK